MKSLLENWRAKAAGVVGGAMLVVGASALEANAEDAPKVQPAAASVSVSPEAEFRGNMEEQSTAHAMSGFNIGLVLHVGDDIPPHQLRVVTEHFRNHYQTALDNRFPDQGGVVAVFAAPNPGSPSSRLTVSVGDQLYQVNNADYGLPNDADPAILDLQTALDAVNDVVAGVPAAKAVQAQNDALRRTASLTSFTPGG